MTVPRPGFGHARDRPGGVSLEASREGTINPGIDTRALAELLWHAEAMDLLRRKGQHRGLSGKRRSEVWDRVSQVCTVDEVRAEVRSRLKTRTATPSARSSDR